MCSRRWCFTLNNYHETDETSIQSIDSIYLVYGREKGDKGTPHLQGFITFSNNKRVSSLKKLIPKAHWEVAKGTSPQASDYCKKDGDYFEQGSIPTQGKRNDLDSAILTLKSHGVKRVAEDHPREYVKFSRGFRDLALQLETSYDHASCRGIWIYGSPGSGKSHAARHFDPDLYIKSQNKWWDGYNGEKTVLLDDLDTNVLGHYLKIWSDRWSCTGETKGGTIHLRHALFVVTSNYPPDHFWPDDACMLEAIERRFKVIEKNCKNELVDFLVLK